MTETIWPTKPKILTIWPLTESLPNPAVRECLALELCSAQPISPDMQPWPEILVLTPGWFPPCASFNSGRPLTTLLQSYAFLHIRDFAHTAETARKSPTRSSHARMPSYHSGFCSDALSTEELSLTIHLAL